MSDREQIHGNNAWSLAQEMSAPEWPNLPGAEGGTSPQPKPVSYVITSHSTADSEADACEMLRDYLRDIRLGFRWGASGRLVDYYD